MNTQCDRATEQSSIPVDPTTARGRWVGETLYWDIAGETIDDRSFRKWCWLNLPEPWNHVGPQIVAWQTRAYAMRREAIKKAMEGAFRVS